ncbi:MAG: (2Fe-2S)-binding protein [Proteobacteria bacterium]|nr:(2Fe-2S)-binding protein [Pseudomonadota bacterium]MDA1136054.1 (2Fe-2S)-binding protein [Pseudomonadota bacterium]
MSNEVKCKLKINGLVYNLSIPSDTPLIFVIRNNLNLKGTKLGCGLEQCGSCTLLVDGKKTLSCNQNAIDFEGKEITTIEGLEVNNKYSLLQEAFIEFNSAQCGYCSSGIIMSLTSLFNEKNIPTENDIVKSLENNLCRCGSHHSVLKAVEKVISILSNEKVENQYE